MRLFLAELIEDGHLASAVLPDVDEFNNYKGDADAHHSHAERNGAKDLVQDGVSGWIFPSGDELALFKAMERAALDRALDCYLKALDQVQDFRPAVDAAARLLEQKNSYQELKEQLQRQLRALMGEHPRA